MLKIEIHCEAAELDLHLLQMGWMRRPFTGAEEQPRAQVPQSINREEVRTNTVPRSVQPVSAEPRNNAPPQSSEAGADSKRDEELSGNSGQLAPAGNPLADELTALERPEDLKSPETPTGAARVRGQPSPGKRRLTAAEVAEDLAYLQTPEGAKAAETEKASISTGEARIDPEDDAVEFAQRQRDALADAADEASETAERAAGPLTLENLRNAVNRYIAKHGVPAWVANGRDIVGCAIVEVPPEKIADAISRVDYATERWPLTKVLAPDPNPPSEQTPETIVDKLAAGESLFGNESTAPAAPRFATKEEGQVAAQKALREYARKYDGHEDIQKAANAGADVREIVKQHTKTGRAESAEEYEAVVGAIETAIRDNPYQRQVHA